MSTEKLQLRKRIKRKKPRFLRQDTHKKSKLANNLRWKKPRGLHSKMRLGKKGYKTGVEVGWGSPKEVKGKNSKGEEEIMIRNIKELEKVDKEKSIVLSSTIGNKKRVEILKKIKEQNLKVSNIKDIEKHIKNIEEKFKERTETKKKKEKEKDEKKKKIEEKTKKEKKDEKKDIEDKVTEEEKKTEEKKKLDKLLTTTE